MNIERLDGVDEVLLSSIDVGHVFSVGDKLYMRISLGYVVERDLIFVVDLETGQADKFPSLATVYPLPKAKVVA